jgi:hypothetical protein
MAVSGTKSFEPDVAEYIEEAFERCGIESCALVMICELLHARST